MNPLAQHWRTVDHGVPNITDETYSVEGLSHLLGIPRDVILHEITTGELRTGPSYPRSGCIPRADVVAWLERRGPGV
ncbi:MAG: hypothetical protein M3Z04_07785 [Chloroflexota bacterium]|nr:hypothetical protein [Chloroflexota bacterium]